jgi:hypothetical protein
MDQNLMITLEPMQIESYKIEERAKAIVVNDAVSYDNTVLFLKEIAQKKKDFKAQRDKYVKPMKDSIKAIDEKLQEPIKTLEKMEAIVRETLNNYLAEVNRREQERLALEKKKAEEEALRKMEELEHAKLQSGEYDEVTQKAIARTVDHEQNKIVEATTKQEKINLSTSGASVSMVWDFEIIDKAQIPVEFLKVDETAIRNAIRAGEREISGVKIFQKPQLSLR